MLIVDQLFEMARNTDKEDISNSSLNHHMLHWLRANSEGNIRNALLELLLHPHVRSFRCRNALGQVSQASMLENLEMSPLTHCGSSAPNVLGTYLLHGMHKDDPEKREDLVYVGQSAAVTPTDTGAVGLRARLEQHLQDILRYRTLDASRKRALYVHQRLSSDQIDKVRFGVLSVFPFPNVGMGEFLRHFLSLMTLAETVDILLVGSLCDLEPGVSFRFIGSLPKTTLRLLSLPRRTYEGLNRALPTKQPNQRLGTLIVNADWSPQDVECFMSLVEQHEQEVYIHGRSGHSGVQWDFLVAKLLEQGVVKTKRQVISVYQLLRRNRELGFISLQVSRWKTRWTYLHGVKQYLERKGLVDCPRYDNDPFYHISSLEDGLKTAWHFRGFLRRSGYRDWDRGVFHQMFFPRYLPSLLHRDIWEKITGNSFLF
jgi:hypothetical protein